MLLQGQEMLTTSQFGAVIPITWSSTNTWSTIVSLYTDLIRLRRNLDGRSSGLMGTHTSTIWQDATSKLIAYRRWNSGNVGDDVIVICNFGNTNWPAYNVSGFIGAFEHQLNRTPSMAPTTATSGASPDEAVTATISIAPIAC
jgi:hypothetical protein